MNTFYEEEEEEAKGVKNKTKKTFKAEREGVRSKSSYIENKLIVKYHFVIMYS